MTEGRFREDLFYRLNMVELRVPPLRHRVEDIPHFVEFFAQKFAAKYQRPRWQPSAERLREFCEYHWPGNIRQLGHIIEQGYVLDCEPRLPELPQHRGADAALPFMDLGQLRRAAVRQALRATRGHKGRAARLLGVHANTMTRLLAQLRREEEDARRRRRVWQYDSSSWPIPQQLLLPLPAAASPITLRPGGSDFRVRRGEDTNRRRFRTGRASGLGHRRRRLSRPASRRRASRPSSSFCSRHADSEPDLQRRFVREVAIVERLNHPNIVRHYDCGLADDRIYFAMELVDCGTLKDVLRQRGKLPWREAVECAMQICAALDHAHQVGVIHRDLKPANLFLAEDGRVKVGDFGLARDLNNSRLTLDGQTVGTCRYMPPEQIAGDAELTGATDLYAVGCILYEMLVGQHAVRRPHDRRDFRGPSQRLCRSRRPSWSATARRIFPNS